MIFKWLQFRNYQLMSKLIITYILLTVIPMSLLGYLAYSKYTTSIEEQVGEYIPLLLEQAHENIDNQVRELRKLPNLIYNSSQVITVLRKDNYQNQSSILQDEFLVNSYLSRTYINGGNPHILGVFILSKSRFFQVSKLPYSGFDFNNETLPYSQDFELQGRENIILPHQTTLNFESSQPYVLLMRQLTDYENRKNLGTMFIAVETTFLQSVLNNLTGENDADIWLMDQTGRIIFHNNLLHIGEVHKQVMEYPMINGSFRTLNKEENKIISLNISKDTDWILAHSIALKELTRRTDYVSNAIIAVFVIFVIISTAISIILAWNVSSPLYHLTKLMKEVEKGNFDVDLSIQTKDEVGMLAQSFNSMIYEIKDLIRKNYQIELKQKEAELYALQSQINPHFMYNTLETIGMAVEEGEKDTVVKMVTLLGRMLRYSISNKDRVVAISNEVLNIKDYLTIQKIRFEERIEFTIFENINANKYFTPKFILQPIIENAIKYSLDSKEISTIDITISIESEVIEIRITDNGPGIEEAILQKLNEGLLSATAVKRDSNFGLTNVHARIVLMFGKKYGIKVNSEFSQGTEVIVTIPIINSADSEYIVDKEEISGI